MKKPNIMKNIGIGALALSLLAGAGVVAFNRVQEYREVVAQQHEEDLVNKSVLSYISRPNFSNNDVLKQISGSDAELEIYNLDEKMVYFSIPANEYSQEDLEGICRNVAGIEFAKDSSGNFQGERLEVGKYVLRKPGHLFFRFPAKDFAINPNSTVTVPFKTANYTMSVSELSDFIRNKSTYNGPVDAIVSEYARPGAKPVRVVTANHGAFVAKSGESSLERLANSITQNMTSNEQKAQALLDFVSSDIAYSEREANSGRETLKRPNEVLMTRNSDCSGKTILYASLLEQVGVDYRLVYAKDHITVAVEGNYRGQPLFDIEGKRFFLAETTAPLYLIGSNTLGNPTRFQDIEYLQRPGPDSVLEDIKTGKPLPFDR